MSLCGERGSPDINRFVQQCPQNKPFIDLGESLAALTPFKFADRELLKGAFDHLVGAKERAAWRSCVRACGCITRIAASAVCPSIA